MSYDLAVGDGEMPADDDVAGEVYEQLCTEYLEGEEQPPSPRIRAFVLALLNRWPDLHGDEQGVSPWPGGPLLDEASGPIAYLTIRWSVCEEVSAQATRIAAAHELVCYDPQRERLRPTAEERDAACH
ncbi:hypothetical protein AB0B62_05500 [Micromonospora chalcea]|uniref:hypothetical protein n=1 Tax=Micromonospora chalcea TaxID=1874 RepID=UPI0033F43F56